MSSDQYSLEKNVFDSLIFDLDGTLWDTCDSCALAWNHCVERNGFVFRKISGNDIRKVAGLPHEECVKQTFKGLTLQEIDRLARETKMEDILFVEKYGGKLFPGVFDGILRLSSKFRLFIVSNCQEGYIETFLDRNGLRDCFVDFECWGRTGLRKAENLKSIVVRNRLKNPIYIGDTIGDQEAADENQIVFAYVKYGFGSCDKYISSFDSFVDFEKYLTA